MTPQRDFTKLEEAIGVSFTNKKILRQAMTHRSYINEHPSLGLEHNERLEFLGDAVLELVATEYLYNHYPNPEGELTNWRSSLVNWRILSDIAKEIGIGEAIYLSRGEAKSSGRARDSILANAIEALIGAMYLDLGYDITKDCIERLVMAKLKEIIEKKLFIDAKSLFQEQAQAHEGITPTYNVLQEEGPDHDRRFIVGAYLDGKLIAQGDGQSKQDAETAAARSALEKKGWT